MDNPKRLVSPLRLEPGGLIRVKRKDGAQENPVLQQRRFDQTNRRRHNRKGHQCGKKPLIMSDGPFFPL